MSVLDAGRNGAVIISAEIVDIPVCAVAYQLDSICGIAYKTSGIYMPIINRCAGGVIA